MGDVAARRRSRFRLSGAAAIAVAVASVACGTRAAPSSTLAATTTTTATPTTTTTSQPTDAQSTQPAPAPAPTAAPVALVDIPAARARAASGGAAAAQPAADAIGAFGAALYRQLQSEDRGANLILSPVSVATVFSMIVPGAEGTTADQLSKVFGISGSDADQQSVNSLLQELLSRNRPTDPSTHLQVTLRIANDVWTQAGFSVDRPFLQRLGATYGAGLHQVNFADPASLEKARQRINTAVSQTTNGRIPQLFDPGRLDPSTKLALVNALYLLGSWSTPFAEDQTHPDTFTRRDGSTVQVPFMHAEAGNYASGSGWQAVKLPLYGNQLSVVLILPDAGRFDDVESSLGPDLLRQARQQQAGAPAVELALPKFKLDTSLDLKLALQRLGVTDAFGAADFDGISKGAGLAITVVAHKTYVAVDEHGIEAAAATGVGIDSSAPLKVVDVDFDRPFLMAVVDEPTGVPLFLGRVTDPSA